MIMQKSAMSCNCVLYSIDVIVVANDEYRRVPSTNIANPNLSCNTYILIYAWLEAPNGLVSTFVRSSGYSLFFFFVAFSFNSLFMCALCLFRDIFCSWVRVCFVSFSLYLIFLQPFPSKLRRHGVCVDEVDEKKVQFMCIEECHNGSFSKWMLNSIETFK